MTVLQDPPVLAPPVVVDLPRDDVPRRLSARTVDDVASLVGSFFGSLALVWVFYEQILAFSGSVGFVICWWAVFIAMYMGVTALSNPWPAVKDRAASTIVLSGALCVLAVIVWVVLFPIIEGWPALRHLNFFTQDMSGVRLTDPLTKGGIRSALVGSAEQVALASAIAVPLGVGTAIYLAEVGDKASRIVRTIVEAMTALPDILAGLFIYTVLILPPLSWHQNGFAVAIALAVTMTPIVARSSEVVLRVVPHGLREASWALGASRWSTVWRVVLPTARAGLATSLILGIARVAGETAPLLIVDSDTPYFEPNAFGKNPQSSLPLYTYWRIHSGQTVMVQRGYAAATVLLGVVLILFVIARLVSRDKVRGAGRGRLWFGNRPPRTPMLDLLNPFPPPDPGEGAPPSVPYAAPPQFVAPPEPSYDVTDPLATPWHQQQGNQ